MWKQFSKFQIFVTTRHMCRLWRIRGMCGMICLPSNCSTWLKGEELLLVQYESAFVGWHNSYHCICGHHCFGNSESACKASLHLFAALHKLLDLSCFPAARTPVDSQEIEALLKQNVFTELRSFALQLLAFFSKSASIFLLGVVILEFGRLPETSQRNVQE